MKLQYVKCGPDSPEKTKAFGYEFVLGGPAVEVTDPLAVKKLSANPSFRVFGKDAPVEKKEDGETGGETDTKVEPTPTQMRKALKKAGVDPTGLTNEQVADKFKGLAA